MTKKFLALLLGVIMMIGLVGCAGTSSTADKTDDKDASIVESTGSTVEINEKCIDNIKTRGKLVVGCKMDVPDLGYYNEETGEWSGLEIELAYKVAAEIFEVSIDEAKDYVEIAGVTVADREEKLENGDIDCMIATYTITDERAERFALSDSYYTDYIGLLVKDSGNDSNQIGDGDINSTADLDGKYIGVPRNATTREAFMKYIDTMNTLKASPIFCEYDSYENLFKALNDGNIDVMSVDVSILNGYVDSNTKILNDRFGQQDYGAAVKKENIALIEVINKVIE